MQTALLLTASNLFMTIAWYGHLRHKDAALWRVILVSWLIAFFEYCLQVPANRWGSARFSTAQLKIMQEIITLLVFSGFLVTYLKEPLRWNHGVAFLFIVGAVAFAFLPDMSKQPPRSAIYPTAKVDVTSRPPSAS